MVDYLIDREREMWNYLRVNMTDPSSRGTATTDTFSSTAGQTVYTLTNYLVKQITSVTVNGSASYNGHNYLVSYGEGKTGSTTLTFRVSPGVGTDNVVIAYKYGKSMLNEGFAREDSELPRINIIPTDINQEYVSIGENSDGATSAWIYYNCTYRTTIRSRYAKQLKTLYDEFSKLINTYRQSTPQPYKTIEPRVQRIIPQDFDNELRLYQAEVIFTVKWMIKYKD
ncbi:hypothetical protein D4R86_00395 [bacterium]|nr:MAG: hypothetical protein D4R86_00395 [bacterium]